MVIARAAFIFFIGLVAAVPFLPKRHRTTISPRRRWTKEQVEQLPRNMRKCVSVSSVTVKKQHEEMLKRGETAAELASDLYESH